jgi:hypothetical protein
MKTTHSTDLAARLQSLSIPAAERARILREAEFAERVAEDIVATWRDLQRVAVAVRGWFGRRFPIGATR